MKGLLLKDLLCLKSYRKTIFIFLICFGLGGINNPIFILIGSAMITTMCVTVTFSYDNLANWDQYALTLPVTKKQLVISKYILNFIFLLVGLTIGIGIAIGIHLITNPNTPFDFTHLLPFTTGILFGLLLLNSFQYPLMYRYGVEKGRLLIFLVFGVVAAIGAIGAFLGQYIAETMPGMITAFKEFGNFINQLDFSIAAISLITIAILCFFTSCLISCHIVEKKKDI